VDEEDSELPVKRNSKRQKKKPERNLTEKRPLVVNQNDVESGEDKDTDKLKDDNTASKSPMSKLMRMDNTALTLWNQTMMI